MTTDQQTTKRVIYLDSAATTRVSDKVYDAMVPFLTDKWGNPGSPHSLGREARTAVETARGQVGELLGAKPPGKVVFTSSGSEANNMAIFGVKERLKRAGRKRILYSAIEHESVFKSVAALEEEGFYVTELPVDNNGVVDVEFLTRELQDEKNPVGLVCIMDTNNEIGVSQQTGELAALAHQYGALYHADCVQSAGYKRLDVEKLGVDSASISAHKIHGPKGVGALYIRSALDFEPMIHGGAGQEFGLRGGTENVAAIVGFGVACDLAGEGIGSAAKKIKELKSAFVGGVAEIQPAWDGISINANTYVNGGRVLSVSFDGVSGETMIYVLDAEGVYASAGAACSGLMIKPNRILTACGISPEVGMRTVRFSFDPELSVADARSAGVIVGNVYRSLGKRVETPSEEHLN